MSLIRPSTEADLPAITAIYGHHVMHGTGTFETTPPTEHEMAGRRADVLGKGLPFLVAEQDGRVLGYAYCQWFKPRPAYRFSAEDSIYLHRDACGKGVGKQLLAELVAQAESVGVRKLIAVIGDSANAGSIGVHRSLGFASVGTITNCGWKFNRWLDTVLMDKVLGEGSSTPPESP
ncbi:N-acetyltransferase family protein [Ramlibacter henchirensis]|uniref:N-acetyltransferase family protein n=1 Tax=Ramlibacter henchirensis TaxID=204072 RepID=A0A4Z0C606_9BURK|nr:GNAT family N-acetyltransferase [Ramlibacter henchirensis]TFZ05880.1 N-acetyltransferase family protein [Ramlibacter henchirensis]